MGRPEEIRQRRRRGSRAGDGEADGAIHAPGGGKRGPRRAGDRSAPRPAWSRRGNRWRESGRAGISRADDPSDHAVIRPVGAGSRQRGRPRLGRRMRWMVATAPGRKDVGRAGVASLLSWSPPGVVGCRCTGSRKIGLLTPGSAPGPGRSLHWPGPVANWGCVRRRRASPEVRAGSARGPVDKETQRADGPRQRHAMGDAGSEGELRRTCDGWRHQRSGKACSGKACSGTAGRVTRGFRLSGHCVGAIRSRRKPSHGEPCGGRGLPASATIKEETQLTRNRRK